MHLFFNNETTVRIDKLESALAMLKQHGARVRLSIDQSSYPYRLVFEQLEDEPVDPLRLAAEIAGADVSPIAPLEDRP